MKFTLPLVAAGFLLLILSCKPKGVGYNDTIEILEQFSELQTIIDSKDHEVLVLNFWSTTCAPCIKEMPHFNKLETAYLDKNVKILLVSLEKVTALETRIYPFVKKHGIIPEVVVLKDQFYTKWTDKIDEAWYGALPATLIIKNEKRKFRFGAYDSYEELQSDVDGVLMQ